MERLCACCYEQAWYAKLGGVVSIKFLMERLPLTWVLQNQQTFLKALLFVMMDLTGEVGGGWPQAQPCCCRKPVHPEEFETVLQIRFSRSLDFGTASLIKGQIRTLIGFLWVSKDLSALIKSSHRPEYLAQCPSKRGSYLVLP